MGRGSAKFLTQKSHFLNVFFFFLKSFDKETYGLGFFSIALPATALTWTNTTISMQSAMHISSTAHLESWIFTIHIAFSLLHEPVTYEPEEPASSWS